MSHTCQCGADRSIGVGHAHTCPIRLELRRRADVYRRTYGYQRRFLESDDRASVDVSALELAAALRGIAGTLERAAQNGDRLDPWSFKLTVTDDPDAGPDVDVVRASWRTTDPSEPSTPAPDRIPAAYRDL